MAEFMNKVKYFIGIEDLDEYDDEIEEIEDKELDIPIETKTSRKKNNVVNIHTNANMKIVVREPINLEDAPKIDDDLKSRKTIVVNLGQLEVVLKKQIFYFINGKIYSMEGNIHKVAKDIFILAPDNVEINGKIKNDLKNDNIYNW